MEHILAFGLGIMLVSTIVLFYVVVKASKKVDRLSSLEYQIEKLYHAQNEIVKNIYLALEKNDRKIDSRVDKLNDVVSREIEEANRKVEFLRKTLGKDYF